MKKSQLLQAASLTSNLYLIMKNKEMAQRLFYIAAGAAVLSKQKIETMAQDFIDKSEMTEEEGKKFLEELTQKAKDTKDELEAKMEEAARKAMEKMHIATTDELNELKARLEKLEKQTA